MLGAVLVGGALLTAREQERERRREQQQQLELLHDLDLRAIYLQINRESFGDQLPSDIPVTWADLSKSSDCGGCGGMTSYPNFKPMIQINIQRVTSEEDLLPLLRHEMCHVEVRTVEHYSGADSHALVWQACMTRFK